jgi:transposase InsO family protein
MRGPSNTDIVLSALTMAVGQRLPEPGPLQHSDRGSQYMLAATTNEP